MLYKIVNNIASVINPYPVTKMESSYYNLRDFNNQRIYPLYYWNDTYKHSFFPEAIDLLNNLATPANHWIFFISNFLHK